MPAQPNNTPHLNKPQRDAVNTIEGPLLIIAGAGSGKTRVITYRIARMLESGIPQHAILALTFTNKAAREMQDRVKTVTGRPLTQLTVSTFHAFGAQILRDHPREVGLRENFSIYDNADQVTLLKETGREQKVQLETGEAFELLALFSRIKTGRSNWQTEDPRFKSLYDDYNHHLRVYNSVDFDDLIFLPIVLFEQHPDVLSAYRTRFRYVLVDEFQDTSMIQYRFLKSIADGSRNVCVVGDDDQSIYSWRGANVENIRSFEADFPELREIKLEQNYRSTGTILDAANRLIAHNSERKEKTLWTGVVGGSTIELHFPENERAEGEFIADTIKTLAFREQIRYEDVGVLIRTNALARSLEEAFLAQNLPYKLSGGTSFFQRQEIKDVLAYLRVCANPDDDVSLLRVLNVPRRGIGKRTIEGLNVVRDALGSSLFGAMLHVVRESTGEHEPPAAVLKTKAEIAAFIDLVEEFRPRLLSGKNLAETVKHLMANIDYWGYLVQEFQKNEKIAKWRWKNIEFLMQSLHDFEQNPDIAKKTIFAYLQRVTLNGRDAEDENTGKGSINLMTIHAAKGLEFDHVFIAGVEQDIIPHKRSVFENDAGTVAGNIEEERRLFYVAITRAKQRLFLTACRRRRVMREETDSAPSPFLAEIPSELIVTTDAKPAVQPNEAESFFATMKQRFAGAAGGDPPPLPGTGIEPAQLIQPRDFKSLVSTNFTIPAKKRLE